MQRREREGRKEGRKDNEWQQNQEEPTVQSFLTLEPHSLQIKPVCGGGEDPPASTSTTEEEEEEEEEEKADIYPLLTVTFVWIVVRQVSNQFSYTVLEVLY